MYARIVGAILERGDNNYIAEKKLCN